MTALDQVLGDGDEVVVARAGGSRFSAAWCQSRPELAAAADVGHDVDAAALEPGLAGDAGCSTGVSEISKPP